MAFLDTLTTVSQTGLQTRQFNCLGPVPTGDFSVTVSQTLDAFESTWYSDRPCIRAVLLDPNNGNNFAFYNTILDANPSSTPGQYGGNVYQLASGTYNINMDLSNWTMGVGVTSKSIAGWVLAFVEMSSQAINVSYIDNNCTLFIDSNSMQYISTSYTGEQLATSIDSHDIYAKRALCDHWGNQIDATYATKDTVVRVGTVVV